MVHLHFFGFGDPLCRFSLEQRTGLHVAGFRPLVLDELLAWSQRIARHQHWEIEPLQQMVITLELLLMRLITIHVRRSGV